MKKISRKSFLKKGLLGTATLSVAAGGCLGSSDVGTDGSTEGTNNRRYRWNMVTTWPPNYPIIGEGLVEMTQWIESMSGGRLKIKVYGGGELIPALECFDAVSSGTAEMGHGAAYYWAGKVPAAQFFGTVPFGLNAQQMNSWLLSGGGLTLWRELYDKYNLIPFPCGNTGVQMGGWFNKEINSVDDLKGLKMRIPGFGGKVFARAGGAPVLAAGSELYTSLERGVIDATEWIGPFHDYKMGLQDIAKYYYVPGWHEPGASLELIVNKAKFNSLPADLQAIVETAAMRFNNWMIAEMEVQNALFLEKILEEGKVELRYFSDDVLNRLRELTDEMIAEVVASDDFARRVYESYDTHRQRARRWSAVTEKQFHNKLQAVPDE